MFKRCGKKLFVEKGCYFGTGKDISVGNMVKFGYNFRFMQRVLCIGNDVIFEQDVLILGRDYSFSFETKNRMIIITTQKPDLKIGDHVIIGARTIILSGCTTIGNNVLIRQGSIVINDIPENSIVEGNPAIVVETIGNKDI